MAKRLSPSVNISEIDKSIFVENIANQPTAFVGSFVWGPAAEPTLISNESSLVSTFGKPTDSNYESWLACSDFLQYASSLYASRAVNKSTARNAVDTNQGLTSLVLSNVSGNFDLAVTTDIDAQYNAVSVPQNNHAKLQWDDSGKVLVINQNSSYDITLIAVNNVVTGYDADDLVVATAKIQYIRKSSCLVQNQVELEQAIQNDSTFGSNTSTGQDVDTVVGSSPVFASKFPGSMGNSLGVVIIDVGATNVTLDTGTYQLTNLENQMPALNEVNATSTYALSQGAAGLSDLFHILVIDTFGRFTGSAGSILERFESVSKLVDAKNDTNASIYWKNVINNTSAYIIALANPTTYGYAKEDYTAVVAATTNIAGLSFDDLTPGSFVATPTIGGYALVDGDQFLLTGQTTTSENGLYVWHLVDSTLNLGYAETVAVAVGEVVEATLNKAFFEKTGATTFAESLPSTVAAAGYVDSTVTHGQRFGGWGFNLSQAIAGGVPTKMATVAVNETHSDATTRYIGLSILNYGDDGLADVTGAIQEIYINQYDKAKLTIRQIIGANADIINAKFLLGFAESRQDCVVFLSPEKSTQIGISDSNRIFKNVLKWFNTTLNSQSSYGFADDGWYLRYDKYTDKTRWVPLNGQTAGLSAFVDHNFEVWIPFAGFRRGFYKNVIRLAWSPNQDQRDQLFRAGCNPVISDPGTGVVLIGDATLLTAPSAFNVVSVRKLFIQVENQIAAFSRLELFQLNTPATRSEFVRGITPFLESIKAKGGIIDFRVVCDDSNNTSQIVDNQEFVGDILIQPSKSIRWVQLNFVAVSAGLSFNEIQI